MLQHGDARSVRHTRDIVKKSAYATRTTADSRPARMPPRKVLS